MTSNTVDLLSCEPGRAYRVALLQGGAGFRLRLRNLGILEGQTIIKLHTHAFSGPVMVQVGPTQVALGRGMAARILVEPLP